MVNALHSSLLLTFVPVILISPPAFVCMWLFLADLLHPAFLFELRLPAPPLCLRATMSLVGAGAMMPVHTVHIMGVEEGEAQSPGTPWCQLVMGTVCVRHWGHRDAAPQWVGGRASSCQAPVTCTSLCAPQRLPGHQEGHSTLRDTAKPRYKQNDSKEKKQTPSKLVSTSM